MHGAFLGYLWCFVRLFIPTPSGRKRVNVLGALHAITHELITVVNDTCINSESVCESLWQITQHPRAISAVCWCKSSPPFSALSHLASIKPKAVEDYKTHRLSTIQPRTINRELAALRLIFTRAIEWQYVKAHPMANVKELKFRLM